MTKWTSTFAAGALALTATAAMAAEPGVPPAFPTLPVLQPGQSLTFGFTGVRGPNVGNDGKDIGSDFSVNDLILQYTNNTGIELFGGRYRWAARMTYQSVTVDSDIGFLDQGNNTALGDIQITPIDIVWAPSPGVFYSAGVTLGLPTGDYVPLPGVPSTGNNVLTAGLQFSATKITQDWLLTGFASYVMHDRNDDNGYKSADRLTLFGGAFRNFDGGLSIGPIASYSTNIGKDSNPRGAFGGGTFEVEQKAFGLGLVKQTAGGTLSVNYLHGLGAKNATDGNALHISYTVPLGKKPGA